MAMLKGPVSEGVSETAAVSAGVGDQSGISACIRTNTADPLASTDTQVISRSQSGHNDPTGVLASAAALPVQGAQGIVSPISHGELQGAIACPQLLASVEPWEAALSQQ